MGLIEDISDEEWEFTFKVNIHAMFYLTKANFGADEVSQPSLRPRELATTYVVLADPLSSYVAGSTIAVTGGKPIFLTLHPSRGS